MRVSMTTPPPSHPARAATVSAGHGAVRWFGRFQLLRLLGKGQRSMAWSVLTKGSDQPLLLVLPRIQTAPTHALEHWLAHARQVEKLKHPHLAPLLEVGVREGWPYLLHDLRNRSTLTDSLTSRGQAGGDAAALIQQAVLGLAYVHDAGLAHHDVQAHLMLLDSSGHISLAGTGAALCMAAAELRPPLSDAAYAAPDADYRLRNLQRWGAERDLLACGLVMHHLLLGQPALDQADTAAAIKRLPPLGHEVVRLPWALPIPVSEPLRAIVNRATDRQERQRYRNARTLLRALEGWRVSNSDSGGPLALLQDRLRLNGVLPAMPSAASRAGRLTMMDSQRTSELAEVVLEDLAMTFEVLRMVNAAQARHRQAAGASPVLTVRRAIALMGVDSVRRAASASRKWPGPLDETAAAALQQQISRTRRAARIAVALRPAGYDSEVVFIITVLQDLGRLVLHYHFPEEALQIQRLTQPEPATNDQAEEPGMAEEAASFAVLGVDTGAMGLAVARHWAMADSVLTMVRRLPLSTPVHKPVGDEEQLRALASCAHETVEALGQPAQQVNSALHGVVQRYAAALGITAADLQAALRDKPLAPDQAVDER
jgi:eukaryotic-like serine/threonine-protein kinase